MLDEASLLSIHRFSEMTGVPDSTLRYYDSLGLLSPASRGRNQYRYYLPHQVTSLNFITVLSELGVPLAQIADLIKKRTPDTVLEILMERERELDLELKKLQSTYALIHTFQTNIMLGEHVKPDEIAKSSLKDIPIVVGSKNDWEKEPSFYNHFASFCKYVAKEKISLHYPVGGIFECFGTFEENPTKPDYFFSVYPGGNDKMESGKYVTGYAKGSFAKLASISEKLRNFANSENIKLSGKVYVTYLLDEVTQMDESEYLAQIQVKI